MVWANRSVGAVGGARRGVPVGPVLLAVALSTLAGCGGSDGDKASAATPSPSAASGTASSSASPSPTDTSSSAPVAPAARNTTAGREKFTRFVVDAWGYALRTNDPRPVTTLSAPKHPCVGCPDLEAALRQRRKQHWYVAFPGADVHRVTVRPAGQPRTWVGTARVDIPASTSYFDDGSFRNTNAAHDKATFAVTLRLQGAAGHLRYTLLEFSVG